MSAKKCLWKGRDITNVKMWLDDLVNTLELGRIRFFENDELKLFNAIWLPLIQSKTTKTL